MGLRTKFATQAATIAIIAAVQPVGTAAAQTAPSNGANDTGPAEIVVTANKREQSINDVGITVAALSGEELTRRGINDIQDLARNVPTLQYAPSANNTPIFTIRGVGFVESTLSAYPTVSVSLDQIPLPLPALTALTAFDLERVEVLKGPQGTLFGQNTTGGAINYVAAKPTDHMTAGVTISYGRFNRVEGDAYVSGPLSDQLLARLSTRITHMDDWQHSLTRPTDRQGEVETYAGRLLLDYKPSETAHFELNVNAWQDKSDPIASQFVGVGLPQAAGFVDPRLFDSTVAGFQPIAPKDARFADWTAATPQFANNKFFQAAIRGDIDLSDDITLTSITSYIDYETTAFTDGDGTALRVGDIPQRGSIKSFSQELRLANSATNPFRWVLGGNYSSDKVFDEVHSIFNDQSTSRRLGINNVIISTDQSMKNYAGFANVEYDALPILTLKGGLRYTEADRTAFNCNKGADNGKTSNFIAATSSALRGLPAGSTVITDNECFTLDAGFVPTRTPFKIVLNENNLSWVVGANIKPTPDALFYVNVSKGYKAGSVPRIGATILTSFRAVTQEQVLAYEAGFKVELVKRVLDVTGAAFWYDYRNKQLRTKIFLPPPSPFRTLEALDNIPQSTIKGAEVELHVRPVPGMSLSAAAAYTDGKIDQYSGVNAAGSVAVFDGVRMPFTPKWQFTAAADYQWDMGGVKPFIGATVNHRADMTTIIGGELPLGTTGFVTSGTRPFMVDSYTLVDLRAGIESANGDWRVSVFGENVFNKFYANNVFSTFEAITRYPGMPATWGVSISWKMQ